MHHRAGDGSAVLVDGLPFPVVLTEQLLTGDPRQRAPTGGTMTTRDERLRAILDPSTTAVLTMELQQGVVGEGAMMVALVEEMQRTDTLDTVRRLCAGARDAGARVVHCTVVARPDGAGSTENCKIFAMSAKQRREHGSTATDIGSPGAELVDGLEDPRDIVVPRLHGMTPFTSTSLDQILRNLGVRTVVATGVSVNLGVFGMALTALDLGYQVVIPTDAVAGVPREYADAVLEHSLSLIATLTTTDELLGALGLNCLPQRRAVARTRQRGSAVQWNPPSRPHQPTESRAAPRRPPRRRTRRRRASSAIVVGAFIVALAIAGFPESWEVAFSTVAARGHPGDGVRAAPHAAPRAGRHPAQARRADPRAAAGRRPLRARAGGG